MKSQVNLALNHSVGDDNLDNIDVNDFVLQDILKC